MSVSLVLWLISEHFLTQFRNCLLLKGDACLSVFTSPLSFHAVSFKSFITLVFVIPFQFDSGMVLKPSQRTFC